MSICVVFLCNKNYLNKFLKSYNELITNGNYKGDVLLIIGDDLTENEIKKLNLNIYIKKFPNIIFPNEIEKQMESVRKLYDDRAIKKKFQWHKLHLFNIYLKKWEYILYLDCGINIYSDISKIIDEKEKNRLVAHSDTYPTYVKKLKDQFDVNKDLFNKLNNTFNLNVDHFQTTIMLYDTDIIKENTFTKLYELSKLIPISLTNEQAIMSLYFILIKPKWKKLNIEKKENEILYDLIVRNKNKNKNHILLKYKL